MRLRLPWLISVPLAVIGTLAGHSVGYWAAVPDPHERAYLLATSGHGYLAYAPLAIALCTAVAVLGFVARVLGACRRELAVGRGPHLGLVAALPPCAFVLQELLERYAHAGHVHWGLVASAPFLLGLATQLPFSLLAAAIGFALTTIAERVGQALRGAQPRPRVLAISFLTGLSVDLPRRAALAGGHAGRGPPLLA